MFIKAPINESHIKLEAVQTYITFMIQILLGINYVTMNQFIVEYLRAQFWNLYIFSMLFFSVVQL